MAAARRELKQSFPLSVPRYGRPRTRSLLARGELEELVFQMSAAVPHIAEPIYLPCVTRSGSWAGYIPGGGYGSRGASTNLQDIDRVRVWVPSDPAAR